LYFYFASKQHHSMKLNRTKWLTIAAIIIAIIVFWGGCQMGKRSASCQNCPTQTETVYITDLDTVFQKGKSTIVKDPFKIEIIIRDTAQLDSLRRAAREREQELLTQLDFYRELKAALDSAGVGSIISAEPPHFEVTGEALAEDGTTIVRYSITVTDSSAIEPGTPEKPNPRFFVEINKPVTFDAPIAQENCKRFAVGGGFLFGSNGSNINGMPLVKVRVKNVEVLGAYDVRGKMWMFGAGTEVQFGKKKSAK